MDYEAKFGRRLLAAAAEAAAAVESILAADGSSHVPMRISFAADGRLDRVRPLDPKKIPSRVAEIVAIALEGAYSQTDMGGRGDSTGWRGTLLIAGGGPASLAARKELQEAFLPIPTPGGAGMAKAYGEGPLAAALADAAADARGGGDGELLLAASENIMAAMSAHERLEMLEHSKILKRPDLSTERLLGSWTGGGSRVLLRRRGMGCVLVCSDSGLDSEALLACAG